MHLLPDMGPDFDRHVHHADFAARGWVDLDRVRENFKPLASYS